MKLPIVVIAYFNSHAEQANADRDFSGDDTFRVDPAEGTEAELFLKEQERLQERRRNKLG